MKKIFRGSIHVDGKSHDCLICEINNRRIKVTYEAYNAVERCNTEIFDGHKWNHVLSMLDMGVEPVANAYNLWNVEKRESRANFLFNMSEKICKVIL